jgi:DNA ligase D-like protein (predicted ligase)
MAITDQLNLELEGFPTALRPMQAVSAEAPFSSDDYLFEVKWDGLRCLLFVDRHRRVRMQDRALRDVTGLFPELVEAASRQVKPGTVLDGELVATDGEGRPDPLSLRRRLTGVPPVAHAGENATGPLAYLAFDILYGSGRSLLRQPLGKRKAKLPRAIATGRHLFIPDYIQGDGVDLFEACLERGLEGVMAKHESSTYVPGQRSPFWLKVKAVKSDDFVVLGATPGDPFGALMVGCYEHGRLLPCGSVAGGFDRDVGAVLAQELRRLAQAASPLDPPPVVTAPVDWCRPELVVSIRYSEWAPDGTLRFPIFNGIRRDVHPTECVRHRPRVVLTGRTQPGSPAYDLTRFPF